MYAARVFYRYPAAIFTADVPLRFWPGRRIQVRFWNGRA
jgi:hypothetical protein